MKFSEFSLLEKIGMIGIAVMSIISIIVAVFGYTPTFTLPFMLPWFVFIMIGRSKRRGNKTNKDS